MAGGFTQDGAVQEHIDATLTEAIERVRAQQPSGESAVDCIDCGEPIPEARRQALQGVQRCVDCQEKVDSQPR